MMKLKMTTLNVNGIRHTPKRRAIFKELRDTKSDIIFLQETHSSIVDFKIWKAEWGGEAIFSHGRSNSKGVAILFARGIDFKLLFQSADIEGRYLLLNIEIDGQTATLINIYAPTQNYPQEQIQLMDTIEDQLSDFQVQKAFFAGDLNIQLHQEHSQQSNSQKSTSNLRQNYIEKIGALTKNYNTINIWRKKNPTSTKGTFRRNAYTAHLDYWFIPQYLESSVTSVNIQTTSLSDHSMVTVELGLPNEDRGPGFWQFNKLLLTDQHFVQEMRSHIQKVQQDHFGDPSVKWEWIKFKIKEFCIQYSIKRNRQNKSQVRELQNRFNQLEEYMDNTDSENARLEYQSIKRELSEIKQHQANGAIFRTRANWTMAGEKPTAYFLGLEKRKSKDKNISMLKNNQGRMLTNKNEILQYGKDFFETIYTENTDSLAPLQGKFMSDESIPHISELSRIFINKKFSQQEFTSALNDLNINKTPGSDGLTVEFFRKFWPQLQPHFYNSIMHALENGQLSHEQRTGLITLIPKKDLDRSQLANWRPITLLNVDFKIYSKAIAKRIQSCIKEVVHTDQTGFIRGRYIGENLINIQNIIQHQSANDTQSYLLALDYTKAFDTLRWDLIYEALALFKFGDFITSAIKLLFTSVKSRLINAGFASEVFYPQRGVRQGCCSSPSLFVLAVELLAIMVRQSTEIRGIQIQDHQAKISQYADDATFFLSDVQSLNALINLLDKFASLSGLKMNPRKSHLLLLGNHRHPPNTICGINITDTVKILGIVFKNGMSEDQHFQLNFAPLFAKMGKICDSWSNRNLSLKGKVTVLNSLITSILQYQCACSPTPARVSIDFKRMVTDFLWNFKRSRIAYTLLIQPISEGGLKLADLESRIYACHIKWIIYLWHNPHSILAKTFLQATKQDDIRNSILAKTDWSKLLDPTYTFLQTIFHSWAKFHITEPTTIQQVQEEIIWNNDFLQIEHRFQTWQKWKHAGIQMVRDLLHTSELRFLTHEEINSKYNMKSTFIEVLQIRAIIPCKWKRLLTAPPDFDQHPLPTIKTVDKTQVEIHQASSKRLYSYFIQFKSPKITSQQKWEAALQIPQHDRQDFWTSAYSLPFKLVRETKLQTFQYKVLLRLITCNKYLKNIKIKQDDSCLSCPETDTLEHFLFLCPRVQTFWEGTTQWLAREADLQFNLTTEEYLFGIPHNSPNATIINAIALYAKFYIHRQNLYHEGKLSVIHFLRELRMKLHTEAFLCQLENKQSKF